MARPHPLSDPRPRPRCPGTAGFTLLELIIVMAVIGILASLALPNLVQVPRRAHEAVLKNNLHTLRQVLDQYNGDKGYYPESLDALVEEEYLREIPRDPIFGENEWGIIYDTGGDEEFEPAETDLPESGAPGIIDVYSLSEELSIDGTAYAEW